MKAQVYIFPDCLKDDSSNPLHINKIKFSDNPYKKKDSNSEYLIDMYYKNNSILIQLPKCPIKTFTNTHVLLYLNENVFSDLILPLEQVHHQFEVKNRIWWQKKRFQDG